ncbi:MurR/RpiR family transcriptional regulator [Fictibacillus terranigra]|uniref:MurR/RpiR family transcriptional regulator n=1 Tax=Fictibacillus terranigra TaxID=3058424 RepID=A0ABT8E1Q2_9BACL|nr:MurR/RpiR family transcriptional regulator [Fictibacillus sp. CENA-BCM004]MDN4071827.1 MurR/RpiR family transcriptional regulator [Fictibacillus sp. CENA-BCM004]
MRFEERAYKYEYKLSDTDDQIIEYISHHKNKVVSLSIQALAAELFTVPNTITRFAKKLGYDGYSQLKNNLKEELQSETVQENGPHVNLKKTIDLIDSEKLVQVIKWLQEAKRVLFFGVGDTAPFCEMMVKNLKVSGKKADFEIHRHETMHEINRMETDDVLFLISLSGETPQVLEMAALARERNVKIISLTHFKQTSLHRLAHLHLYCYAPREELNGYNITDRTPIMIILRALSETYWKANQN